MNDLPPTPPGKGFFGWLGRQVGYVSHAIKADVGATLVYKKQQTHEAISPDDPNLKLRRTVIDEAIVERRKV